MKAVLTAVAQSVPQVGDVFALCMIVYIIFGVVGRSLFAGKFYSCNDSSVKTAAECFGFFLAYPDGALSLQEATARGIPSGAVLVPRVWSNARFSFDHIGVGFLTLLEMTSLKWIDKTFAAMDIAGQSAQPIQDNSPEFALFFVLYVYIGSLFVIRLFVGVLVEQFQRNDGTQILTESQKSWVDLEKFVLLLQLLRLIPRPRLQFQDKLYDFCQNPRFGQAISVAIMLNILLLLANPTSTSNTSTSNKVIEIIFLAIFTAEAVAKFLAFRQYYLLSANGAFEIGILDGSLVAYFSAAGYHTLIQAGRIFRVMRAASNPGLQHVDQEDGGSQLLTSTPGLTLGDSDPAVSDSSGSFHAKNEHTTHSDDNTLGVLDQNGVGGDLDQIARNETHLNTNQDASSPRKDAGAVAEEDVLSASNDEKISSPRVDRDHEQPKNTYQSDDQLEADTSPHRRRKHHHHHHKRKHRHHRTEEAHSSDSEQPSDAERESSTLDHSATQNDKPSSASTGASLENKLDADLLPTKRHDGTVSVLVAKAANEPVLEPPLNLLPRSLPRLNSSHSSSKVVPT